MYCAASSFSQKVTINAFGLRKGIKTLSQMVALL